MTMTDSFAALVEQLDSGEDAAARDVIRRYSRQLITLTRRQFAPRLAHRIDPEDVVHEGRLVARGCAGAGRVADHH